MTFQTIEEALDNLVNMGLLVVYLDDKTGKQMVRLTLDDGEIIMEPIENIVSIER